MGRAVEARVTRCDGWWAVAVPQLPGLFTQARRLDLVERQVTDAAALLGTVVDAVSVTPALDSDSRLMLDELDRARAEAAASQRASSRLTRTTVRRFQQLGLSVRDIATLVGLSPQRVSVLCRAP